MEHCSAVKVVGHKKNVWNAGTGSNGAGEQTRSECDYNHMKVRRHATRCLPPLY